VARKVCEYNGAYSTLMAISLGIDQWKASDRWKRGFITDPLTFLNQERWKDTPPGEISKPLAKGEVRVREASASEAADAKTRAEYSKLLRANPSNSEAEIHAMIPKV
jgi:hypothetical protein